MIVNRNMILPCSCGCPWTDDINAMHRMSMNVEGIYAGSMIEAMCHTG